MEILPYIYLGYMFISLYFLSFYFLLFLRNRNTLFNYPKAEKDLSLSLIVPAYNAEKTIEQTITAIFKSDYKNIREVIVVNDCSKDKTREIVERLLKKYPKLKLINNKKNLGNAARAQNVGLKYAKGEVIGVIDDDSYPATDSITKMIGFFNDSKVGAVTCPILARNKNRFFEKLQATEYTVIAVTRKLLEGVDAIYVTPGPLALYRREAILGIGGFDENNLTQDIEATWHITAEGWSRRMCLDTKVTTTVPTKFIEWFKQRQRWNMGGLQTIWKYKRAFIEKKGMISFFILPFFIMTTFLGLLGLSIFAYLITTRLIREYFLMKFSLIAQTAIVSLDRFYFTPSVLNYLGLVLFVMGAIFTFGVLILMKESVFKKKNFFSIFVYILVYLSVYPFIMITGIFKLLRRDLSWGRK